MKNDNKPDRLYCRKSDRETYEMLKKDPRSPFKGMDLIDIFMMAMAVGSSKGTRLQLTGQKDGLILIQMVRGTHESIMKALAVVENNGALSVLSDMRKVVAIAEEYATGGIAILRNAIFGDEYGSYVKKLGSELLDKVRSA